MKKKKLFIALLLILVSNISKSQDIEIKFIQKTNFKNLPSEDLAQEFNFKMNNEKSLYSFIDINNMNNFQNAEGTTQFSVLKNSALYQNDKYNTITVLFKEHTYKNYKENIVISSDQTVQQQFYIKDSINLMKWQLENKVVDTLILGYKCKKATSTFRGRKHIVFYTNEIANYGGPWKYDGLPGFILYAKTEDGFLEIIPKKVKIKTNSETIENPFIDKKTITFDQVKQTVIDIETKIFHKLKLSNPGYDKRIIGGFARKEDWGIIDLVIE